MDSETQLSDLLESNPPPLTPYFQTIITAKKEFNELPSQVGEKLAPGPHQFYNHQRFTHRFLRTYDDLLLTDETGTGKSASVLGFLEQVIDEVTRLKVDPLLSDEKLAHFKRIIILVKGKTQKAELRHQLVCKISPERYLTSSVKNSDKESVQKTHVTRALKNAGYIITTYRTFANLIRNTYPNTEEGNEQLIKDYSDTIFWIDEAHNLLIDRNQPQSAQAEKLRTYAEIWRIFHVPHRCKRILSTATPMINEESELIFLMNLILPRNEVLPFDYDYQNAPENDIRVFFPELYYEVGYQTIQHMTPEEVAPYFRGQIPQNFNFDTATLDDMEPYFRGRIGYIRSSDTGAVPVDMGDLNPSIQVIDGYEYTSNLTLYTSRMSKHQGDAYLETLKRGDQLYGDQRQASNFVFPDGWWGNGITEEERAIARQRKKELKNPQPIALATEIRYDLNHSMEEITDVPTGEVEDIDEAENGTVDEVYDIANIKRRAFRRFVIQDGDDFRASDEFRPLLTSYQDIGVYSCKFAEIVRLVKEKPGNAFVYSEYVTGSGAIVLGLCLEGMGFERYNESTSIFTGIGDATVKPYCPSNSQGVNIPNRRVRDDFKPKFRYAILYRETSEAKFHSMMETMNSYENRHGDYIKVLISSRVGRDGINVNNVLQIHLVGAEWNYSATYQALSRGIRATSHDDLIQERRAQIIQEQETVRLAGGDPNMVDTTVRIPIEVYRHVAIEVDQEDGVLHQRSIDLQMYGVSEYKDRKIKRIMRMMKQSAVGCWIHYNRNVLPTDIDESPKCDYQLCRYECVNPRPAEEIIDYTTYDVLYSREIIINVISELATVYRQNNIFTLDELIQHFQNNQIEYRRKFIIMGLENIITNKIPLVDRYGYTTYLREDSGFFYLDRNYPTTSKTCHAMSYYTEGIIALQQETLSKIVTDQESGGNLEQIEKLQALDPDTPEFEEILEDMSIEGQSLVLEHIMFRKYVQGETGPFIDAILNYYHDDIFEMHEPVTELKKAMEKEFGGAPRRGRKRNPNLVHRVQKLDETQLQRFEESRDTNTSMVYLHTLFSAQETQTNYATTARHNKAEGRTRILKPNDHDPAWRDLNKIELPIYNIYIQIEKAHRDKKFEDTKLFGFILSDGIFRIRNAHTEKVRISRTGKRDTRGINRGKACISWDKPGLYDMMWELQVPLPQKPQNFTDRDRNLLIHDLETTFNSKIPPEKLNTWDLPRLIYYHTWYLNGRRNRAELCNIIQQHMENINRLRR